MCQHGQTLEEAFAAAIEHAHAEREQDVIYVLHPKEHEQLIAAARGVRAGSLGIVKTTGLAS